MATDYNEARVTAVLGPTNTGKTRLAIERMLGRASGVIGLPLRLLAREVYDRVVEAKGPKLAALITGEEKIVPPTARYFVCTVEAMPRDRSFAFVGIDEAQLSADPDRGHIFTDRLLNARGAEETMILGAETLRPLVRRLLPEAEHQTRERLSTLAHAGAMKLSRLPSRSAIVAFSAEQVYAIAEYVRRRRGGAAVVMGALSPRTRNAQVELYQSGEVDFLIATDAIGMGLNMDVGHVAFAALNKFDGHRRRPLRPDEIAQIAGRAGRFRRDGTFGTTGECRPLNEELVHQVEAHRFEPLRHLHWRSSDLDFASVAALQGSLGLSSPGPALRRCRDAVDEIALDALAGDDELMACVRGKTAVKRLWSACQIPDFRKATVDQHVRLVGAFARHLLTGKGHVPTSWAGAEMTKLDNTSGDVDALSARLAHIRTWTYTANRSDWFADPAHWRELSRAVEDRLSDALHDRLTQRFVDRRTNALVKGLKDRAGFDVTIADSGEVTVDGHFLGRLTGLTFQPDVRGGELEARALSNAALRTLRPEVDRRLGALARAGDDAFDLRDDLKLSWDGAVVAKLAAGPTELAPKARLIGAELGSAATRARAERRLEAWLATHINTQLEPLVRLKEASAKGDIKGLARGVLYQLVEGMGAVNRSDIADEVTALSAAERRSLRSLGVRIGEHVVFTPALTRPAPARLASLLLAAGPRGGGARPFLAPPGRTSITPEQNRSTLAYAAAGYWRSGPRAVRLDIVERLANLLRDARTEAGKSGAFPLTDPMIALLGCSRAELTGVIRALGYRRARNAKSGDGEQTPELWRAPRRTVQRNRAAPKASEPKQTDTPFAALAALATPEATPPPARRPRRRRKRTPRPPSGGAA